MAQRVHELEQDIETSIAAGQRSELVAAAT
jgi:hypothetical protein